MFVVFSRLFQDVSGTTICCGSIVASCIFGGCLVFANQDTTVGIQNISEFSCVGAGVVALLEYSTLIASCF